MWRVSLKGGGGVLCEEYDDSFAMAGEELLGWILQIGKELKLYCKLRH